MAVAERAWCVVVPHHARGARQADTGSPPHSPEPSRRPCSPMSSPSPRSWSATPCGTPSRCPGGVVRLAWRLRTVRSRAVIEVRVTDGGAPQLPRPRAARPEDPDGRGLTIVEALADRWGVDRDGLGQCVWAELS